MLLWTPPPENAANSRNRLGPFTGSDTIWGIRTPLQATHFLAIEAVFSAESGRSPESPPTKGLFRRW